ncbi:MAG TPA: PQQ-binding-like beta-propeller repeat protein [Steroidobacteraceae bacterium]|nr:PQQ-binding-like beta-propeller repeat protein [Steroidobacteraceae bacterium]
MIRIPARLTCLTALLALIAFTARAATSDGPPTADPAALYQRSCAACHDHPTQRIPARAAIARHSPDEVMQILTGGSMRVQAAGLSMNDRVAVATYITGKAPVGHLAPTPESNRCPAPHAPATQSGPGWNGWGADLANTRFQGDPGLSAADVPHLKLKWAFGYRATYVYGQPTLVGGRVYVTSSSGRVYSLDARTGCTYWTFDAEGPVRTAVSVAPVGGVLRVVFGDDSSFVYLLDANRGRLLWKRRLDPHPSARITGAPAVHADRVFVPVSSLEELSAPTPTYECCRFRGSVAALDMRTGRVLWRTYTVSQPARPYRKNAQGTQLYGPAGGSVWSAPTLDPEHDLLYVGTGNSYTDVPTEHTDSILALHMSSGAVAWVNQLRPKDNYIVGCDTPASAGQGNCPHTLGPDVDFGTSPILRTLAGGERVLLTGEKSGRVYGLDPQTGHERWQAQVGVGSSLGGIEWGGAADAERLYAPVSDAAAAQGHPGGLIALNLVDGRQLWRAAPRQAVCSWGPHNCLAAQSQAATAIPGVVFSGSEDGHLRAYASGDGHVVWDVDTAQAYTTVNGVPAAGGSLDNGGATLAGGMLFVNSGYGRIVGEPGNVLLAFSVDGR